MFTMFGLALLIISGTVPAPPERASRSATVAKELTVALTEQRLDAIAAQHPDEPDRFVAALFFPDAQLLVVSARYASPAFLQGRLAAKQYRDVYLDLQGSSVRDSGVFFQDMNADGLCSSRDQTADFLYEGTAPPIIFDGDWKKHHLAETDYEQQVGAADERYSRLLEILLTQLRGTEATPPPVAK
jgi:hypothetical protein